jgi:hypothetical protein
MSAQESRKAYQHEFMDRTTFHENADKILDMFNDKNSGADIKERCRDSFKELCDSYDAQFAIQVTGNREWDVVQAKPFDWKED